MNGAKTMTIDDVKKHVFKVERFKISIKGGPSTEIQVKLRVRKMTPGDVAIKDWIANSFPEMPKGNVSVLRGNGHPIVRVDLDRVRATYDDSSRKDAIDKSKAEAEVLKTTAQLEAKKKAIRQLRRDRKPLELELKKTVPIINAAMQTGERGAAHSAIDMTLRDPARPLHPKVTALCKNALSNELGETQALIEWLLAAWSRSEKEQDRLRTEIEQMRNKVITDTH